MKTLSKITFIILALTFFFVSCTPGENHRFPVHQHSQRIVSTAENYLGVPYKPGGRTPAGFDCSGFALYVYDRNGISLPRSAEDQFRQGRRIHINMARPGDLVFFRTTGRRISHVGIYAGNGRFIHAPRSGKSIEYTRLDNRYWRERFVGAVTWFHFR